MYTVGKIPRCQYIAHTQNSPVRHKQMLKGKKGSYTNCGAILQVSVCVWCVQVVSGQIFVSSMTLKNPFSHTTALIKETCVYCIAVTKFTFLFCVTDMFVESDQLINFPGQTNVSLLGTLFMLSDFYDGAHMLVMK